MCGFSGIFNFRTNTPVDQSLVMAMTKLIRHRGPDDSQIYTNHSLGLGFARLSVIDVDNGIQPMQSVDGRYSLAFNGEIYNYQEIRRALSDRGYVFRTNSDTEVILALFESGDPLPEEKLRGMFSFAFYDSRDKRLVLSRDRLGKKPLFWSDTPDGIIFGSEIKSLLKASTKRAPNWPLISDFLTLGYCPDTGAGHPETPFEGIYQVPSGSRLIIEQEINTKTWWTLPFLPERDKAKCNNWEDQVSTALNDAVKYRLISDTPLGIFLSGGLDSALILSLAAKHGLPDNFTAFTAGFDSTSFDETRHAKELANQFGVRHVSVHIGPSDIERIFNDVIYKSDNLLANPAMFANYLLSEVASKEVKAVLHGGGGDELFFGYPTYRADQLSKWISRLPNPLLKLLLAGVTVAPTSYKKLGMKYKATKFLEGLEYPSHKRHYWWRTILTESDKDAVLSPEVSRHDSYRAYRHAFELCRDGDFFEQAAYADMRVWWQYMGLYQGDTMSMANSLEMRMPFMDHELVELMARVPREVKFDGWRLKGLMKRICQKSLPAEVLNRPKSGFHVPLAEWFAGPLRPFLEHRLSPGQLESVPGINSAAVRRLVDDHLSRRFDNSFKITNLLVYVEWYRRFLIQ